MSKTRSRNVFDITDFGAQIDGVTDDAKAWQTAIDLAAKEGEGIVRHPGGNVGEGISFLNANLTNPSAVDIIGEGNAQIKPGPSCTRIFTMGAANPYIGPAVPLTGDLNAGDSIFPGGPPAEMVFLVSDALVENVQSVFLGQILTFAESGEIEGEIFDDFLVADNARYYVIDVVEDFTMKGLHFLKPDDPYQKGITITLNGVRHVDISDIRAELPSYIGMVTKACADVHIRSCTMKNDEFESWGYGITLGASSRTSVTDIKFQGQRHAITTLYEQGLEGKFFGGPVDTTVNNCISHRSYLASYDEHQGAIRTKFTNCITNGSRDAGFQIRGRHAEIKNCTASSSAGQGIVVSNTAIGTHISGNTLRGNETGISSRNGATETVINGGNLIYENAGSGIILNSDRETVQGNVIGKNGDYGIRDSGSSNSLIISNTFIKDGTAQGISIFNLGTGGGSAIAARNFFKGYGGGFGDFNTAATATLADNTGVA